jgi:hypothetical protein
MQTSSLPCTPGMALKRGLDTVGRPCTRSASYDTPMEGVPERFGPILQPKTPALVMFSSSSPYHDAPYPHYLMSLRMGCGDMCDPLWNCPVSLWKGAGSCAKKSHGHVQMPECRLRGCLTTSGMKGRHS